MTARDAWAQVAHTLRILADDIDNAVDTPRAAPPDEAVRVAGGEEVEPIPDTALGRCPLHGKPWTVKPAGTSKAGKPYSAFWKCDARDADGFCNEKPIRAWADSHPIRSAA